MKATDSILTEIYTRVDIIDYDGNQFSKTATVYLLGEHSIHAKTPSDVNLKNKELVSSIGVKAVKTLVTDISANIIGGDDWDELDEMDVDDLLNTENTIIPNLQQSTKHVHIKDLVSNVVLYANDKPHDVKEKIAIVTDIKPYKQYLWIPAHNRSIDGISVNLFKHYENSHRMIEEFPIDSYPEDRYAIYEDPASEYTEDGCLIMYCISIDAVIRNKAKLAMIANSYSFANYSSLTSIGSICRLSLLRSHFIK